MLKSLLIKDYALIEKIQIEFGRGLNIITGETGAGKSILLGAFSLLLGERASSDIIRKGSSKTIVEGKFSTKGNSKIEKLLTDNELDHLDELIVRREITLKGNNRCFINDTPVNLNIIKDMGDYLVDLHGQHEHQSLLRTDSHINVIDEAGDYQEELDKFAIYYSKLIERENELKQLVNREHVLQEKKDLIEFQLKEIDAVSPQPEEDLHLDSELLILENSEKLLELTSRLYNGLYEDEGSAHDVLVSALSSIQELVRIDPVFEDKLEEFNSAVALVNDVAEFMRGYRDKIDFEPARVEAVRERLGALNLLKKKYGGSIESVLNKREEIAKEFEMAENYSENIAKIKSEIEQLKIHCGNTASRLSDRRKKSSGKICEQVISELAELGIENAGFKAVIKREVTNTAGGTVIIEGKHFKADKSGIDEVEFFINTNKGEDLKPLAKVASGGEISRIMLSLKSVLAKNEKLPLLVFDEIDTGISGRIAGKVGKALKSLAEFHQIIAITHLPQIAAMAHQHFAVEKEDFGDRVASRIRKLSPEESLTEVAKLLSGENVTEASLDSARQLVKN